MNQKEIPALQERLRLLMLEDVSASFRALREALPDGTPKENAVYNLEARFNDLERDRLRGIISPEDLQLAYNQIRAALLDLIASLEEADFKPPSLGSALPAGKTGSLLHKIPEQMQLGRESKCIVRLAFEEETIIRNLEITEETTIQSIRISEVMEVALLDPNAEPTFAIRSVSTAEQFVERGDYSEWLFFVQPLREGVFPLLLKVAVVELVQGRERRKEIVLEETVQILTSAPTEEKSGFKPSGYLFSTTPPQPAQPMPAAPPSSTQKGGGIPVLPLAPVPLVGQVERSLPQRPKRSWSRLAPLASVLVLLVASLFWLIPNLEHQSKMEDNYPVSPLDTVIVAQDTALEGSSWQIQAFFTTDPVRQRMQDSLLAVLQPLIYHFGSEHQLRVQNAFGTEKGRYLKPAENKLLLQGASWKASGEIRYQRSDSLVLLLTYTYTQDTFPVEVRLRRLP